MVEVFAETGVNGLTTAQHEALCGFRSFYLSVRCQR